MLGCPLYSMLSLSNDARSFFTAPGVRLCVVATNVAETSLTIPASSTLSTQVAPGGTSWIVIEIIFSNEASLSYPVWSLLAFLRSRNGDRAVRDLVDLAGGSQSARRTCRAYWGRSLLSALFVCRLATSQFSEPGIMRMPVRQYVINHL